MRGPDLLPPAQLAGVELARTIWNTPNGNGT